MQIQDELIDVLMQFQFNKLEHINLCIILLIKDGSKVGEAGVRKLVSKNWPALKKISLCRLCGYVVKNNIEDAGLAILIDRAP